MGGECADCKRKKTGIQRCANGLGAPEFVPSIVYDVLRSSGQPLDSATRAFMEPRFGQDFRNVRTHTDLNASESARSVHARAYTVGQNVVFGAGQYVPGSEAGKRLLAHELTHVVQQGIGPATVQTKLEIGNVDSTLEREAEQVSATVANNTADSVPTVQQSPTLALQRACGPAEIGTPNGCTSLEGDVVGERFRFVVSCDSLKPGEQSRMELFAQTLSAGETAEIHGFASTDGDPVFNEHLSCARALKAQQIIQEALIARGVSVSVNAFNHGATPGSDAGEQRSVIVTRSGTLPPPPLPVVGCVAPTNADESSSAFNPTTSSQAGVIASHPVDAFTVNGLADDALALASGSGLPGLHLGPADALRHCFWNCRMAQVIGAPEAEEFATGHENSGPSDIPFDNQMDLHDNSIGRGLGTPGADCEAQCRAAVTAGRLRSVRGPHTPVPATPPITTDCIGASNQPWP